MNDIWLQYRQIIFPVVFYSFGVLWFSLNFYIWQCYKMRKYKDQIDKKGSIIEEEISFPFRNFATITYLFSSIPSESKYYKFDKFKSQVNRIKSYRKFYKIAFPIYFITIFLVLYIEIKFY